MLHIFLLIEIKCP